MIFIKSEVITSLVMALTVTVLVLIHTPKYVKHPKDPMSEDHYKRIVIAIRSFVISFIACYALVYIFSNDGSSSIMSHIKTGEPDF